MDKQKFNKISLQYGNLEKSNEGFLTEIGFIKYFSEYFLTKSREQIIKDFELLGYESDFKNHKLKSFTFSVYCSEEVQVQLKNSLEDNYDSFSYQHELRKYGEKVESKSSPQSLVFIRKIKSEAKVFYFGV